MKTFSLASLPLLLLTVSAQAGTLDCSSIGEMLPENRLIVNATLEKTLWGTITGGSFQYKSADASANDSGAGKFTCGRADAKGVLLCKLEDTDSNIQEIVIHPVLGLAFQISGQRHVVLFNCK